MVLAIEMRSSILSTNLLRQGSSLTGQLTEEGSLFTYKQVTLYPFIPPSGKITSIFRTHRSKQPFGSCLPIASFAPNTIGMHGPRPDRGLFGSGSERSKSKFLGHFSVILEENILSKLETDKMNNTGPLPLTVTG